MSTLPSNSRALPADVVRGIADLAPLPATAHRLMALLRGDDESLTGISALLESDQGLVASLLRRANSARYMASPARTAFEAVMRIGTVSVLDLVIQEHLRSLIAAAPTYGLDEQDLWLHGAAAQLAVRALRTERPLLEIPATAETAALLHDIGKLIISRYLKVDGRDVTACAREHGLTWTEAERRLIGFDHTTIGAAVAEHWRFPDDVALAIRHHHDAETTHDSRLLDAVMLANVVAKMVGAGLGAEGLNFGVSATLHERLSLDFEVFARICLTTQENIRDLVAGSKPPA